MPDFFIPKTEKELTENVHIVNFALELPPEISELISFIDSLGGKAFIVGGSVRDSILSAKSGIDFKPKDFDFEVYGIELNTLITQLSSKYGEVDLKGKAFGVLKINLPGFEDQVDISLPRTDSYSEDEQKGRGIISNPNPYLDKVLAIKRRDITINSLLYDPVARQIIDPFNGWDDLMEGIIRVTDKDTFKEDPLRVIRVAQISSRFGFRISKDTLELSKEINESGRLKTLEQDRLLEELDKLLIKGYTPSFGFRFLKEIGYLDYLMPELTVLSGIPQDPFYHPEGDAFTHTMQVIDAMSEIIRRESKITPISKERKRALMLGALFHDLGKAVVTKIKDNGRISSDKHENAGKPIAQGIVDRVFKKPKQKSLIPYESLILFLVTEHMRPINLHEEHKRGVDLKKAVRKFLVNECLLNETTLQDMLMIVEADKLGRNPVDKFSPLSLSEKPELVEALNWFKQICAEVNIEGTVEKMKKILDNDKFLNMEICEGLTKGPWVGIIEKCVKLDFVDGIVEDEGSALERAVFYFKLIFKGSNPKELIKDYSYWIPFKKIDDPRTLLL